ncbi:MAG: hypothetical protein K940chlam1_00844 [Candidatus Anoxychlamydiales bacterium]|nr:hypothetical protein [Candidatus Anoxychlamydiales bacterium]NGX35972.1 hypothetical protein [Candidatus Anoxychlamydiales bacterium]
MSKNYQNTAIEGISATNRTDAIERSKSVQAAYLASLETNRADYTTDPSLKIKQGFETTLKAATPKTKALDDFSVNKSTLPPLEKKAFQIPAKERRAIGIDLAEAIQRNEKILNEITDIITKNIDTQSRAIIKLSDEEREQLDKLIAQLSKKENVDTLKRLLNVVTASTAIVAGSVILAPETLALAASSAALSSISSLWGYLLVATGVSNIATNEIFPRFDIFNKIASFFTSDETEKQKLSENIQVSASLTNTILSFASALATSPLLGAVLDWSFGTKILTTATEIADGTVNIISDVNRSKLKNLQSSKTLIDGKKEIEQIKLDQYEADMESAIALEEAFNRMSYNVFQTIERTIQNINR